MKLKLPFVRKTIHNMKNIINKDIPRFKHGLGELTIAYLAYLGGFPIQIETQISKLITLHITILQCNLGLYFNRKSTSRLAFII